MKKPLQSNSAETAQLNGTSGSNYCAQMHAIPTNRNQIGNPSSCVQEKLWTKEVRINSCWKLNSVTLFLVELKSFKVSIFGAKQGKLLSTPSLVLFFLLNVILSVIIFFVCIEYRPIKILPIFLFSFEDFQLL